MEIFSKIWKSDLKYIIQVKVLEGRRVSINPNKKQGLPSINPIIVLDFFV